MHLKKKVSHHALMMSMTNIIFMFLRLMVLIVNSTACPIWQSPPLMKSLYASLLKDRQPSISASYEMVAMTLDPTRTQAKPSSGMPMQEVTFLGNFGMLSWLKKQPLVQNMPSHTTKIAHHT
jgi:hypothetical protein